MDVEQAKLVSILAVISGGLVSLLGILMLFGLDFSTDAYGSVALVWTGLAFSLAGRKIRRTGVLLERPRWFFAACLFGIASSAGLYKTVLTDDLAGAIGMVPLQLIALYALWRSLRQ